MPRKKAPQLRADYFLALLPAFLASGLNGREFGRRNGLTEGQAAKLSRLAKQPKAKLTEELTDVGQSSRSRLATIARDHAEALCDHGGLCSKFIASVNEEIKAAGGDIRKLPLEDINRLRYAWSVVGRLNQMFKPDHRLPDKPGEIGDGQAQQAPHLVGGGVITSGMLTIVDEPSEIGEATAGEAVAGERCATSFAAPGRRRVTEHGLGDPARRGGEGGEATE